ncbi:DUF317 domain-containing protein [Kitasatospora sp. NPDC004669]|uniref:DUF317 domain-containing protein n=1 Tax=Kitasatospora sp. NPDC004669 TaxID=3154555 RepID=UPI0033A853D1
MIVSPGYLAGPGDPEAALAAFLDEHPSWNRYSHGQDTTVAIHEQLTAKIELNHEETDGPRWTIASYESPVGQLAWRARFSARTPHEVVTAVARRLSYALAHPSNWQQAEALWGRLSRDIAIEGEAEAAATSWNRTTTEHQTSFSSSDGTAGVTIRAVQGTSEARVFPMFTVWGGPRSEDHPRWEATFTPFTPTTLITAALGEVTQPVPAIRRASQIPAVHRSDIRSEPRHRPRFIAAQSRSAATVSTDLSLPDDPWSHAAAPTRAAGRQP